VTVPVIVTTPSEPVVAPGGKTLQLTELIADIVLPATVPVIWGCIRYRSLVVPPQLSVRTVGWQLEAWSAKASVLPAVPK
jgi:hypothetical protein